VFFCGGVLIFGLFFDVFLVLFWCFSGVFWGIFLSYKGGLRDPETGVLTDRLGFAVPETRTAPYLRHCAELEETLRLTIPEVAWLLWDFWSFFAHFGVYLSDYGRHSTVIRPSFGYFLLFFSYLGCFFCNFECFIMSRARGNAQTDYSGGRVAFKGFLEFFCAFWWFFERLWPSFDRHSASFLLFWGVFCGFFGLF
jgi:hypothetical protein